MGDNLFITLYVSTSLFGDDEVKHGVMVILFCFMGVGCSCAKQATSWFGGQRIGRQIKGVNFLVQRQSISC